MILMTVLAAATLAVAPPTTDTTFAVKSGTRLSLENYMGSVAIDTWSRDAVRVRAEHRRSVEVSIESSPGSLELSAESKWGVPGTVDWHLTLPAWMSVGIEGVGTDVAANGLQGELKAETVKGDIKVDHCFTAVVSSVEGEVAVSDCRGRVEASSVNETVRIQRCGGELQIESVNGDVVLENCESPGVDASSVNGAVLSSGPFRDNGSYGFSAHNGDIIVALSERASVAVTASTYSGEFSCDFPVQLSEKRKGREYRFTLGGGGASLELDSFQGRIHLVRPESWDKVLKERAAHPHAAHDRDGADDGDQPEDTK